MGDNRNNSEDSRFPDVGNIKREDIIGRAWLRIYPFSSFGLVSHINAGDEDSDPAADTTTQSKAEDVTDFVLTGDDLAILDCVLHFRRIETMFEGMRWFDIKRYGIEVVHYYRGANEDEIHIDTMPWNDPRRVLQLPKNVIDAGYPANRGTSGAVVGGSSASVVNALSKDNEATPVRLSNN